MPRLLRSLPLLLALTLAAACDHSTAPQPVKTVEETTFNPVLGVDLAAMTKLESGLYYRDLVVGTGTEATTGKKISVRYAGFLPTGEQFDATNPTAAAFQFTLGSGTVISGWNQGVAGMKVGGQRQLVIPSGLAYGNQAQGTIPANSVLVFVITVVDVQ